MFSAGPYSIWRALFPAHTSFQNGLHNDKKVNLARTAPWLDGGDRHVVAHDGRTLRLIF